MFAMIKLSCYYDAQTLYLRQGLSARFVSLYVSVVRLYTNCHDRHCGDKQPCTSNPTDYMKHVARAASGRVTKKFIFRTEYNFASAAALQTKLSRSLGIQHNCRKELCTANSLALLSC